ncbi:hypothetical protein [Chitinophaga sancti]|uniref:Dolichyl-phosphate-mannose-protein mannosyltransferase n=1 Tax=Chitinophaga sancti TaxID=1004 RepID=A0A1K1T238_9BACT|nr:hypothetical protein [Chitinophaga sancti]WQD59550.1 hypothetical protein U0033_16780 [Chitinophaga sancti]WQG88316.1 hypothetical protein SR876_25685 [Chitinophaga sancti]SFW90635.1 hypothetical protein SAMN05661012_06647 [Chitinophaga sancti]
MSNPLIDNNFPASTSLKDYILKFPENRFYLIISVIVIVLQLIIYKYLYPYANFLIGDSYCYIKEAFDNAQIANYPIGYPMFLRFFSALTVSDTCLVVFQYFLVQGAAISLLYTLFYFFNPHKYLKRLLIIMTLFNPLLFVIANTVSSDNLFLSLSVIWINLLIWIIYRPTKTVIFWHAIILFFLLTVRFNALFYPFISLFAFFQSKEQLRLKIVGVFLFSSLMLSFVIYNREKYFEISGKRQFSVFSGWQMANNGLYAYRHVPVESRVKVPNKFDKLDAMVRNYFYYANKDSNNRIDNGKATYDYMFMQESPLWIYCLQQTTLKEGESDLKTGAVVGPLYAEYGAWLILHYPVQFIEYVIWPNVKKWFIPPMEMIDSYNGGAINVPELIAQWFKYKSVMLTTRVKDPYIFEGIIRLYPLWACVVYIIFLLSVLYYFIFKWRNNPSNLNRVVMFITFFWIINFCFNVFASPIQMRHVLFPVQMSNVFSFLIIGVL